ncbi:MAG: export transporter periplasmic protein LptC [Pseudomonadota bacterium]|jgi:lipopolysaccharide export system protein LptC
MKLPAPLRHGWDRSAVYLPVLIMGVLALGSYWVLRSTPAPKDPAAPGPVLHEPDYTMQGFSVRSHEADGSLRSELAGSEARHYPDNDAIEIDQARLRAYGDLGQLTRASALRLSTDVRQSQYRLEGAVVVERSGTPDGQLMRLRSEQLFVARDGKLLWSEQPVVLQRGPHQISADRLRYDSQRGIMDLQGRVRAQLAPR